MCRDKSIGNKSLILIDDSNLYYVCKKYEWKIDYKKFYRWITKNFDMIGVFFFGGIITEKAFFDLHPDKVFEDFIKEKKDRQQFFKFLIASKIRDLFTFRVYSWPKMF